MCNRKRRYRELWQCKEIWQDDDGWWAKLKTGWYWGVDNNTIFNGETWEDLVEAAKEIHR